MAQRWERLLAGDTWYAADRWGWPPTVTAVQPARLLSDLVWVQIVVDEYRREQAEADAKG